MKTAILNARIEPELKNDVEKIFQELGISPTQAITMFYKQVILNNGLPFEVKIPNTKTMKTILEGRNNKNMHTTSVEELKEIIK
ncbi:MAG: type II toxin-antitoxin system RelB/DinJ family antitoxin [Leptospiraceae bacterium]|nr:type II toxin-antitoxin system RelB/DinJ family antitoxin [Leptospiraceae bacterium]MCP5496378.1 type II toxin-antitoxin system RelB/DinJ family antitoxin [Leptospiraceae bacterium]